jgi:radical SAM-linked protein
VEIMAEYRLRFGKLNNLRYLSHLNLMKTMERAVRRAGLPLAFSGGFHPHPKISYGPALAVGIESTSEYLDLELTTGMEATSLLDSLNPALPQGLFIYESRPLQPGSKTLNALINKASYQILFQADPGIKTELKRDCDSILQAEELLVTRTGKDGQKTVNIRPWLHNLTIEEKSGGMMEIHLVGEVGNQGNLRPEEILAQITQPITVCKIIRNGLWNEEKGRVKQPMDFGGEVQHD